MGKIMGKLKHTYIAFPDLQTKFFHKQCVILSFRPNFNEFHHNFNILTQFPHLQEEVSPTKLFQIE